MKSAESEISASIGNP